MATDVPKDQLRNQLMAAREDIALAEAGYLRSLTRLTRVNTVLEALWAMADLGELPEYEPEVRVRKVS